MIELSTPSITVKFANMDRSTEMGVKGNAVNFLDEARSIRLGKQNHQSLHSVAS